MGYAHGTRWTDDLIKEKVLEVKNALELDRMPSRKECENFFHNCSLTNAISRRCGGWVKLSEELGLSMKESDTWFGKRYEKIAAEMLQSEGFEVRRMNQNFPYDLLVDNCVKVDVKASKLYTEKNGSFYSFNLEKDFATCDFFILLAVSENEEIERTMIVPSWFVIANNQISVGVKKSKYHRFTDRWDLIGLLIEFCNKLVT
jgi:hypothetical protein